MKSRWNARADSVSTAVLWIGGLIAALICVVWLTKNLYPEHVVVQRVENELIQLQRDLNTACRMDSYWKNYFPKLNEGNLMINDIQVCIDSSSCKALYYELAKTGEYEPSFMQGNIVLKNATPCTNIQKCSVLYYNGNVPPNYSDKSITIPDATLCFNKHTPILRCRLLICSTNSTMNIHLNGITAINITKQNATFAFKTE
ncbi:MAG: hypothetical protein QXK37_06340 [Candidatus Woesearchaeota archaeon]